MSNKQLSDKLDHRSHLEVVVVFQNIQIKRLSQQKEILMARLKGFERQLFNAANYEVQIKQLTQQNYGQQQVIELFREESQKMNRIAQALYRDNDRMKEQLSLGHFQDRQKYEAEKEMSYALMNERDKWKNRCAALQKSRVKELEDLRNTMEGKRKSGIDRQIRELTIRYENQIANLESQLRKARQLASRRERESEELQQKCQKQFVFIMNHHSVPQQVFQMNDAHLNQCHQNYFLKNHQCRQEQMINISKKQASE